MDAKGFGKILDGFGRSDLPDLVKRVHQKIDLEALHRLVLKTPVDTGRARSNWQVTVDDRPEVPLYPAHVGTHGDFDKTGATTIRLGQEVIAQLPAFCVSFLTNHVEYIGRLEDGHSAQSEKMLALTYAELVEMFRDVRTGP